MTATEWQHSNHVWHVFVQQQNKSWQHSGREAQGDITKGLQLRAATLRVYSSERQHLFVAQGSKLTRGRGNCDPAPKQPCRGGRHIEADGVISCVGECDGLSAVGSAGE